MTVRFSEIAAGVYLLRYPVLSVNVTLITGDGEALLVDTLSTPAQAAELGAAAARVTDSPWTLVNTHHHFDHCFGNATLADPGGRGVWGHEETAAALAERGEKLRRRWYAEWEPTDPTLAAGLAEATLLPPNHTVRHTAALDVGGRPVTLTHHGPGHTAGDLVVGVPDAGVVIVGDLVEEGAPPDFADAYPLHWPETLTALLHDCGPHTVVVPGHGTVVDRAFVTAQHAELTALEWLIRQGHADRARPEDLAGHGPYPAATTLTAVRRGYAELDGLAGAA